MTCFVRNDTQSLDADDTKGEDKSFWEKLGQEFDIFTWNIPLRVGPRFLIDSSFHLSLVVTCGRDLETRSFSHLNVSAAVPNGWGTRGYWWVARYVRHDLFICPKRAWSITAAAHLPVSAPFFCCALCHLWEPLIALFQSCHSVSDVNARPPGY